MVAAVAVQDVDRVDLIEVVLRGVGREDAGHARIETGAEERGEAGLPELILVSPLPAVVEVGGEALLFNALLIDLPPLRIIGVLRLVVGGVDIVHLACKAGVHDREILIGKRDVQDRVRLVGGNERDKLIHVVRIDLCGRELHGGSGLLDLFFQRDAFFLRAARDHELREGLIVLAALLDSDLGYASAADDK